jgi:hypothetical protein
MVILHADKGYDINAQIRRRRNCNHFLTVGEWMKSLLARRSGQIDEWAVHLTQIDSDMNHVPLNFSVLFQNPLLFDRMECDAIFNYRSRDASGECCRAK